MAMADHNGTPRTPREMVRAHAYPVLAAISTLCLVVIAAASVYTAKHIGSGSRCVIQQPTVF